MKQTEPIFSKWLITGFSDYCIGSDKELYRLPFKSGCNYFGLRRLKIQNPNRYKILGKWWSKSQLKDKVYLNPNPEILIETNDMPF
jgi:hypothetical protein